MRNTVKSRHLCALIAAAIVTSGSSAFALTDNTWLGLNNNSTLSTATDMTNGANWSLGHVPDATERAVFIYGSSGAPSAPNVGNLTLPVGFAAGAIKFQILNSGDGVSKLIVNNNMTMDHIALVSNGVSSGGDMNQRLVLSTTSNVTLNLTGTTPLDASLSNFKMINPGWIGNGGFGSSGGYQISVSGKAPTGFRTSFNLTNSNITFASPSQAAFAANDAIGFTSQNGIDGTSQDNKSNTDNSVINFTASSIDGLSGGTVTLESTGARKSGTIASGAAQMNIRNDQTWIADPTSLIRVQHRTVDTATDVTERPVMVGSLTVAIGGGGIHTIDGSTGTQRLDNLGQVHFYVDFKNDDYGSSAANGMRIGAGTYGSLQINNEISGGDPMAMNLSGDVTFASNGVTTGTYTGDGGNVPATTTAYGLTLYSIGALNNQNVLSLDTHALTVTQGVWLNSNSSTRSGTNVENVGPSGETMRIDAAGSTVTIGGDLVYHSLSQSAAVINTFEGIDSEGFGAFATRKIGLIGDANTVVNLAGNFITNTASHTGDVLSLATVNLIGGATVKTFEVGDASTKTSATTGPVVPFHQLPITGGYSIGTLNIGDGVTAGNVQLVNNSMNDNTIVITDGSASKTGEKLVATNLNIKANSTLDLNGLDVLVTSNLTISPTGTLHVNAGNVNGNVVMNGGLLRGYGKVNGSVTAGSGPHTIAPSATVATTGQLQVGALTTNADTTLAFNLTSPGVSSVSDRIKVTGANALVFNGGKIQITASPVGIGSLGWYNVIEHAGFSGSVNLTMPATVNNVAYTMDGSNPTFIRVHRGFLGDANDDGTVNFDDFLILSQNFGQPGNWNKANFIGSPTVDFDNFLVLSQHFGQSIGSNDLAVTADEIAQFQAASQSFFAGTGVPEPTSLAMLGLGAAALLSRRSRKVNA